MRMRTNLTIPNSIKTLKAVPSAETVDHWFTDFIENNGRRRLLLPLLVVDLFPIKVQVK